MLHLQSSKQFITDQCLSVFVVFAVAIVLTDVSRCKASDHPVDIMGTACTDLKLRGKYGCASNQPINSPTGENTINNNPITTKKKQIKTNKQTSKKPKITRKQKKTHTHNTSVPGYWYSDNTVM